MSERKRRKPLKPPLWDLVENAEHNKLLERLTNPRIATDTEIKDKYGTTPIEWLIEQLTIDTTDRWDRQRIEERRENWQQTAYVLVEHSGADLTKALPTIISHKAATELRHYRYAALVDQMIRKSSQEAQNKALMSAIQNTDAEITTSLLERGADASSPQQLTPLAQAQVMYTLATWRKEKEKQARVLSIIDTLFEHKADTNVQISAQHPLIAQLLQQKWTVFDAAVMCVQPLVLTMLLEKGNARWVEASQVLQALAPNKDWKEKDAVKVVDLILLRQWPVAMGMGLQPMGVSGVEPILRNPIHHPGVEERLQSVVAAAGVSRYLQANYGYGGSDLQKTILAYRYGG